MRWLNGVFREIFALFVEDGAFAIAILAWLAIVWLILPRLGIVSPWNGLILPAGLICILMGNALRYAARGGQTKSSE